ncbi:hypothetical protein FGO68_gene10597 [Halteria grandinella]|uniref:DUF726 domain-containing protein n=1 Tax=Halteria grandinella TaxID=5974 RepID=A0A8J8P0W9_HALGN|nr:hypothetical protein FGO68_gene10597 [Halteria grandinella]
MSHPEEVKQELEQRDQYLYQGRSYQLNNQRKIRENAFEQLRIFREKKQTEVLNIVLNQLNHLRPYGDIDACKKHIVLTFSGFLSQNDDSLDGWSKLNDLLDSLDISCFDVKWQSIQYSDIGISLGMEVGKQVLKNGVSLLIPSNGVYMALKIINGLFQAKLTLADPSIKQFCQAIINAKQTGKLLAIALALGYPFPNQTISLIGFSLGSQVIKSTIKTLHKIGVHDLIQNVHFLGGACQQFQDNEFWQKVLHQTVRGRSTNTFSKEDAILKYLYKIACWKKAIGREPQLEKSEYNASEKEGIQKITTLCSERKSIFRLKNHECKIGHLQYRGHILEICKQISIEER